MNDIIIFAMGCFVSLVVIGAVGLLLWGAANEPRGSLARTEKPKQVAPASQPTAPLFAKSPRSTSAV